MLPLESGHSLVGTAIVNHGADEISAYIVADKRGTNQKNRQ
jgi:hypothetical protein